MFISNLQQVNASWQAQLEDYVHSLIPEFTSEIFTKKDWGQFLLVPLCNTTKKHMMTPYKS